MASEWSVEQPSPGLTYEDHEAWAPTLPLCRRVSSYAADAKQDDTKWDRPCTKYVRTHSGVCAGWRAHGGDR